MGLLFFPLDKKIVSANFQPPGPLFLIVTDLPLLPHLGTQKVFPHIHPRDHGPLMNSCFVSPLFVVTVF